MILKEPTNRSHPIPYTKCIQFTSQAHELKIYCSTHTYLHESCKGAMYTYAIHVCSVCIPVISHERKLSAPLPWTCSHEGWESGGVRYTTYKYIYINAYIHPRVEISTRGAP